MNRRRRKWYRLLFDFCLRVLLDLAMFLGLVAGMLAGGAGMIVIGHATMAAFNKVPGHWSGSFWLGFAVTTAVMVVLGWLGSAWRRIK